ncbi:MAG: hypothetical protein LC118_04435 [Dehalococcoidia bacterium]|nr:hypothetical protein [Dehalococcoidia bacterium]
MKALDDNFRGMAADEIERFRREIIERTGDLRAAEGITDQDLLREVMNTVGKAGPLGANVRCEAADLDVAHLQDVRLSTVLFKLTTHLLYKEWRARREAAPLRQLKRITGGSTRYIVCKSGRTGALQVSPRWRAADHRRHHTGAQGERRWALLDPIPSRPTAFSGVKPDRWDTSGPPREPRLGLVLDVVGRVLSHRRHPRVVAYTKNHNLGFEVPYRCGSEVRRYRPDFVVLVDDGRGPDDLLRLVIETKGYRREDAKAKKLTMETYWVPGVNNLKAFGRWAFAELTDIYEMEADFGANVAQEFDRVLAGVVGVEA